LIVLTFVFSVGNQNATDEDSLSSQLRSQIKHQPIEEMIEQLKSCPVGLVSVVKKVISFGVGIHHAGNCKLRAIFYFSLMFQHELVFRYFRRREGNP
jgi:hypothetical protein